ncbi:MAG: PQQ-binding-like beta-propeller repeat protein, partial [Armatimonadaceae bacterium]
MVSTPSVLAGWGTTAAGGQIGFSSPAIGADGTVYVGSLDGNLYAFSAAGTLKWTMRTGGAIESSPTISADGTIYIGSTDRKLYAVQDNGTSARVLWSNRLNGPVFGSPTLDKNGYLYFAVAEPDNQVYCVDSLNGKSRMVGDRVWSYTASGPIQAHLLMDSTETAIFVADIFGNVHKVSTATATAAWSAPYQSGSTIYSSAPVLATSGGRDLVLFGTIEGKFHAVDSSTGELAWADAVDLEGQIYGTAAVSLDGETVYIGTYDNISGLERSRVVALKTVDGTMRWADTAAAMNPGFSLGF